MRRPVCCEHTADFFSNDSALEVERPDAQDSKAYREDSIIRLEVDWIRSSKPFSCVVHADNENIGRLEGI